MKTNSIVRNILFICVCACAIAFLSCEKSDVNKSDNNYVNSWIFTNMKHYYFWNEQIPSSPNMEQFPSDFFYSLLYKYRELDGDRFSWIQENYVDLLESLSGVNSGDLGFEYVFHRYNNDKAFGEVLYVKPGTSAQTQGIKRGDVFLAIDGTEITVNNYSSLLQKESMTITFVDPLLVGNTVSFSNERNISITKIKYTENPVFLDSIYEINGKKVGYLVYNFFASDAGNNSAVYDKQLNSVFQNFQSAGVNNIIVDLRYNSGGSALSAARLASMIVNPLNAANIFYILTFNSNTEEEKQPFLLKIENERNNSISENINNIGGNLQKVCFITGRWSASASEMLINGLEPFMSNKIIIVGDTTVGKSYASYSFYESNNPRNKWGMQPLIAMFTNGSGAEIPATGIIPDYPLNEILIMPKKQLGDTNEELLKSALAAISGQPVTQKMEKNSMLEENVIGTSINKKAYSNQAVLDDIK
ncbi:MAG: hypothetical protein LBQ28_01715 [Prevotellaceae bacterium]|nr:hypothetical protein [Prevotellaceae bacterium]